MPYRFATGGGGVWQELDRITLSGTSTTMEIGYADKERVLILIDWARDSATADPLLQLGDSSVASGSVYARRLNDGGGGSDSVNDTVNYISKWATGSGSDVRNFEIHHMANQAGYEKMLLGNGVFSGATGSSTSPSLINNAGKWAETSNQAGYVKYDGSGGTTFSDGSEILVLGYDSTDTSGGFFGELTNDDFSSTTDTYSTSTFDQKKYNYFAGWVIGDSGAELCLRVNGVTTGTPYSARRNNDGSSSDFSSDNFMKINASGDTSDITFMSGYFTNVTANEKLFFAQQISGQGNGTGDAPRRSISTGKWADTSNAITQLDFFNNGTGDFTSGQIAVWGND